MKRTRAYEEVIDFIAAGMNPQTLIDFEPSQEVRTYVSDLVVKEKTVGLSSEEKSELDHYMELEHFMRLAKARALQYLPHE